MSLDTAVGISRRFDSALREAQLANIATWLINLGTLHADLGSPQTALVSLRSAVAIHRRLAEADPGTYLDCLRSSLNDLGTVRVRSAEAPRPWQRPRRPSSSGTARWICSPP
ncbi:hypothetical protein [Streptomyces sp. AK010]|uniref:hypothetical protein n=1 Tax=Streptomyces sp. AK010 TaxID=2723074 RepID=UPI001C88B5E9